MLHYVFTGKSILKCYFGLSIYYICKSVLLPTPVGCHTFCGSLSSYLRTNKFLYPKLKLLEILLASLPHHMHYTYMHSSYTYFWVYVFVYAKLCKYECMYNLYVCLFIDMHFKINARHEPLCTHSVLINVYSSTSAYKQVHGSRHCVVTNNQLQLQLMSC